MTSPVVMLCAGMVLQYPDPSHATEHVTSILHLLIFSVLRLRTFLPIKQMQRVMSSVNTRMSVPPFTICAGIFVPTETLDVNVVTAHSLIIKVILLAVFHLENIVTVGIRGLSAFLGKPYINHNPALDPAWRKVTLPILMRKVL